MDWLSKYLDNLLCLVKISATQEVNNDSIGSEHTLGESLRFLFYVKDSYCFAWDWNSVCVALNERSHEFICFFGVMNEIVVVTHLFEQTMANKTVDACDKVSFAFTSRWLDYFFNNLRLIET